MDQIPIPLIEKFLKEDIRDADYLKMLDGTNMKTIVENENFRIDSQKHALNISPKRLNLQLQNNTDAEHPTVAKSRGRIGVTGHISSKSSSSTIATLLIELPVHHSVTAGRMKFFWLTIVNPINEKNQPSNGKGIVRTDGTLEAPFVDNNREATPPKGQGEKKPQGKGNSGKASASKAGKS